MMEHTDSGEVNNGQSADFPALPPSRLSIIGVPITATNIHECVAFLTKNMRSRRGNYICVSNVHTTVMAREDPLYWKVQSESLMSIPDGKPLSVIGRKTCPSMDRVTGPKLMKALFESPELCGERHYFYGGTQETIDQLVNALQCEYPRLRIAGHEPSVFRDLSDQEVVDLGKRIDESAADFVWIGIGAPRQEPLCSRLSGDARAVLVGVGGAFNIFAGITSDAPEWMQKCGLEWLYRLIQEPRRLFKRYLVTNTKFISYLLTDKFRTYCHA